MGAVCQGIEDQPKTIQIQDLKIQYPIFQKSFNESLTIDQSTFKQKIIPQHIIRRIIDENITFKQDAKTFVFKYPFSGYIIKQVKEQNLSKPNEQQIFDGTVAGIYLFDSQMKQCKNFYYGKVLNHMTVDQDGFYFFQNGDYYKGNIYNNKAKGKGVYTSQQHNYKYEGQWKDNMPQGQGTQQTQDYFYTGAFSSGNKQGKGQLKYKRGDITYEGFFSKGAFNGQGVLKHLQKQIYNGQFKNGSQNGHGSWLGQNGQKYQGQFINGKKHGKGKYTFSDGTIYDGEFKNGLMNGEGSITKGQQKSHGVWMDNKNMIIFGS